MFSNIYPACDGRDCCISFIFLSSRAILPRSSSASSIFSLLAVLFSILSAKYNKTRDSEIHYSSPSQQIRGKFWLSDYKYWKSKPNWLFVKPLLSNSFFIYFYFSFSQLPYPPPAPIPISNAPWNLPRRENAIVSNVNTRLIIFGSLPGLMTSVNLAFHFFIYLTVS